MANMATDSWLPHRFAQLSDRLTMQDGVLLMGGASLATLLYTRGDIVHLVTMYSINVFVTFSLSQLAMLRYWWRRRRDRRDWGRLFEDFLVIDPDRFVRRAVSEPGVRVHPLDGTLQACAEGWNAAEWREVAEQIATVTAWISPNIPVAGDPGPFHGTPALG